jgi:hypothetical protein
MQLVNSKKGIFEMNSENESWSCYFCADDKKLPFGLVCGITAGLCAYTVFSLLPQLTLIFQIAIIVASGLLLNSIAQIILKKLCDQKHSYVEVKVQIPFFAVVIRQRHYDAYC